MKETKHIKGIDVTNFRHKHNISQKDLSKLIGVSVVVVSRKERDLYISETSEKIFDIGLRGYVNAKQ